MNDVLRDPRQDEQRNMDCRVTRSANGHADACYQQSAHRDAEWPGTQIRMLSLRAVRSCPPAECDGETDEISE